MYVLFPACVCTRHQHTHIHTSVRITQDTGNTGGLWGWNWETRRLRKKLFTIGPFVSFAFWNVYYLCSKMFKRTRLKVMHLCRSQLLGLIWSSHQMKWVAHWGSSGCSGGGVQLSGKMGHDSQGAEASQSCKCFRGQVDGVGNIVNSRKSKTTTIPPFPNGPFQICNQGSTG